MQKIALILSFIFCFACNNSEDRKLLYRQLENYNADLKMSIKTQDIYLSQKYLNDKYLKHRFDSLKNINSEFEKEFEKIRYRTKSKVLILRDNFNRNNDLRLQFDSPNQYENIPDSIFNKLIETDILRLKKEFQNRWMFFHGDKFK